MIRKLDEFVLSVLELMTYGTVRERLTIAAWVIAIGYVLGYCLPVF